MKYTLSILLIGLAVASNSYNDETGKEKDQENSGVAMTGEQQMDFVYQMSMDKLYIVTSPNIHKPGGPFSCPAIGAPCSGYWFYGGRQRYRMWNYNVLRVGICYAINDNGRGIPIPPAFGQCLYTNVPQSFAVHSWPRYMASRMNYLWGWSPLYGFVAGAGRGPYRNLRASERELMEMEGPDKITASNEKHHPDQSAASWDTQPAPVHSEASWDTQPAPVHSGASWDAHAPVHSEASWGAQHHTVTHTTVTHNKTTVVFPNRQTVHSVRVPVLDHKGLGWICAPGAMGCCYVRGWGTPMQNYGCNIMRPHICNACQPDAYCAPMLSGNINGQAVEAWVNGWGICQPIEHNNNTTHATTPPPQANVQPSVPATPSPVPAPGTDYNYASSGSSNGVPVPAPRAAEEEFM
jgi:hypothetical protein